MVSCLLRDDVVGGEDDDDDDVARERGCRIETLGDPIIRIRWYVYVHTSCEKEREESHF